MMTDQPQPQLPPSDEQPQPVEEPKKPVALSYDPAMIPAPINGYEQYVYAALVELRAMRKALGDLTNAVKAASNNTKGK